MINVSILFEYGYMYARKSVVLHPETHLFHISLHSFTYRIVSFKMRSIVLVDADVSSQAEPETKWTRFVSNVGWANNDSFNSTESSIY